jgi:hypothetical protein
MGRFSPRVQLSRWAGPRPSWRVHPRTRGTARTETRRPRARGGGGDRGTGSRWRTRGRWPGIRPEAALTSATWIECGQLYSSSMRPMTRPSVAGAPNAKTASPSGLTEPLMRQLDFGGRSMWTRNTTAPLVPPRAGLCWNLIQSAAPRRRIGPPFAGNEELTQVRARPASWDTSITWSAGSGSRASQPG